MKKIMSSILLTSLIFLWIYQNANANVDATNITNLNYDKENCRLTANLNLWGHHTYVREYNISDAGIIVMEDEKHKTISKSRNWNIDGCQKSCNIPNNVMPTSISTGQEKTIWTFSIVWDKNVTMRKTAETQEKIIFEVNNPTWAKLSLAYDSSINNLSDLTKSWTNKLLTVVVDKKAKTVSYIVDKKIYLDSETGTIKEFNNTSESKEVTASDLLKTALKETGFTSITEFKVYRWLNNSNLVILITPEWAKKLEISSEETILSAAEREGINLPYLGKVGRDSASLWFILNGEVNQKNQEFLTGEQTEKWFVLTDVATVSTNSIIITNAESDLDNEEKLFSKANKWMNWNSENIELKLFAGFSKFWNGLIYDLNTTTKTLKISKTLKKVKYVYKWASFAPKNWEYTLYKAVKWENKEGQRQLMNPKDVPYNGYGDAYNTPLDYWDYNQHNYTTTNIKFYPKNITCTEVCEIDDSSLTSYNYGSVKSKCKFEVSLDSEISQTICNAWETCDNAWKIDLEKFMLDGNSLQWEWDINNKKMVIVATNKEIKIEWINVIQPWTYEEVVERATSTTAERRAKKAVPLNKMRINLLKNDNTTIWSTWFFDIKLPWDNWWSWVIPTKSLKFYHFKDEKINTSAATLPTEVVGSYKLQIYLYSGDDLYWEISTPLVIIPSNNVKVQNTVTTNGTDFANLDPAKTFEVNIVDIFGNKINPNKEYQLEEDNFIWLPKWLVITDAKFKDSKLTFTIRGYNAGKYEAFDLTVKMNAHKVEIWLPEDKNNKKSDLKIKIPSFTLKSPLSWDLKISNEKDFSDVATPEIWKEQFYKVDVSLNWWNGGVTFQNWTIKLTKDNFIFTPDWQFSKFNTYMNSSIIWDILNVFRWVISVKDKNKNIKTNIDIVWKNIEVSYFIINNKIGLKKFANYTIDVKTKICSRKTLWVKLVWWAQAWWDIWATTDSKSNYTDISKAELRASIKKNAETLIRNMTSGTIVNKVKYINWDVSLSGTVSDYETLVIKNWNVTITWNVKTSTNKPLWIIVLNDNFNSETNLSNNRIVEKWNIFVTNNVTEINAVIYADGALVSADQSWVVYSDSELKTALKLKWSLFTRNTIWGSALVPYKLPGDKSTDNYDLARVYDLNNLRKVPAVCNGDEASETVSFTIEYDSRIQSNPPKGFIN